MRVKLGFLVAFFFTTLPVVAVRADDTHADFPRPAGLESQVRFWRQIFVEYSVHQVVLHDAVHLDKVYKVLDFRPELDSGMSPLRVERLQRAETDLELERIHNTLLRLHSLGGAVDGLGSDERRIYDMFADDTGPDRFLVAADDKHLRAQRGLRERFAEGIRVSRRYLPEMERIFREDGLPPELTRLPLVESCFNLHAYSKVGAAGIWQFMPATGRRFLRVDNLVDERRDPIFSTRAAARFLDEMHDSLGAWPLAITAYNHGPEGVARAVGQCGTRDIATIVRDYHGSAFGFASRNFYAEFLAALDVERNYREYFGNMPVEAAPRTREHRLDRALGIQQAAHMAHADRDVLATLNPSLSSLVLAGRRPIPRGARLRLPEGGASGFETRLAEAPVEERVVEHKVTPAVARHAAHTGRVRPAVLTYRVQRGQTLSHIAKRYRVSVASLCTTNGIGKTGRLRPGQTLRIPRGVRRSAA